MAQVFPKSIEGKHTYIQKAVPYIVLNKARLLVSTANADELDGLYGDVATAHTYLNIYSIWVDDASGRTLAVDTEFKTLQNKIIKVLMKIYADIPRSVWTDTDRVTFNRKTGLPVTRTVPTVQITANVFVRTTLLGDGQIKIKCYTTSDGTRASLAPNADGVEVSYRVDLIELQQDGSGNDLAGKVKPKVMEHADDGGTKVSFTQATFVLKLAKEAIHQQVHFFVRWINSHHTNLNGPWSGPTTTPVL
ncbi:MAG: hypothetical protein WCQ95_02480 [Bacteroidota bacterium]